MVSNRFARCIAPLAFMALMFLSACKDDPVAPASTPVTGMWQLVSANGIDATLVDAIWNFSQSQVVLTQGYDDCTSHYTYTTSGSKLLITVVSDECNESSPGDKDTINYAISGETMTLTNSQGTLIMKKVSSAVQSLMGTWDVETVDGNGPSNGAQMTFTFTGVMMKQRVTNGTQGCGTDFVYTTNGTALSIRATDDTCGEIEVGATDTATYSIAGNKLTMTFSDGTRIVSKKR